MSDSGANPIDQSERSEMTGIPSALITKSESTSTPAVAVNEDDINVKQVIDMLRGDDMGARVAAAHRLDLVALTLGEQRTREVPYY